MISKINGNYLFFPKTGTRDGQNLASDSAIWLSHVSTGSSSSKCKCAQSLTMPPFNGAGSNPYMFGPYKYCGLPIRPVVNP